MTSRPSACQEFSDRLQRCADERRAPRDDAGLISHTRACPPCREDLDAWMRLEAVLHDGTSPRFAAGPRRRRATPAWSVAAAVMVMVTAGIFYRLGDSGATDGNATAWNKVENPAIEQIVVAPALADRLEIADLDPALWWHDVRNRDWVGQTMPAIESVQQGVAPLGRTLMRAVTILTTGGPLPGGTLPGGPLREGPSPDVEGQTS